MKIGKIKPNENGYREIFNLAPSQYFKGEIDDVRFYDQQLSAGLVSIVG